MNRSLVKVHNSSKKRKAWKKMLKNDDEVSDYFHANFLTLQKTVTPQDMKKFLSLNDNSERIGFLLRYPLMYDLPVQVAEDGETLKNSKKALQLKDIGNSYFGRGEFLKALETYSNAALLAPQKGNCRSDLKTRDFIRVQTSKDLSVFGKISDLFKVNLKS